MRHCDDDTLAALALGDPVDANDAAHVDACAACAAAVEEIRATASLLVSAGGIELTEPPARVWDGIEAALAADAATGRTPEVPLSLDSRRGERRGAREARRLFAPWTLAATAAAGVLIGGVGVALATRDVAPEPVVVAQAALADLATEDDAGTARVERRDDGSSVLVVDTTFEEAVDGNLEVWLIDTDIEGMVSLGYVTAEHTEFEIPAGFDVGTYPIVDISVEPADGDPTHSGDSITRGILS